MEYAIEIRDVCFGYKDFHMDRMDLKLPKGSIMGLIGENGAGKTTLLHCILGLKTPNCGEISVLGGDILRDVSLREDVGVVLDTASGLPSRMYITEIEKMMRGIYKNWDKARFYEYLKQFGIPEKRRFSELSRGMKMKLMIATALSHGAKLLILDEATNGLDPVVRDEILDIFMDFTRNEEHSVLISSHIVSDLEKVCDYVAFLLDGKLVLSEEKDRLCERYGLWKGTAEELSRIPADAILGKRENAYGAEALVRREDLPHGYQAGTVSLEELFLYMSRRGSV